VRGATLVGREQMRMLLHRVEAWRELLLRMLVVHRPGASHMLRLRRVLRPRLQLRVLRLRRHRLREDGDRRARRQWRRRRRLEAGLGRPREQRAAVIDAEVTVHVQSVCTRPSASVVPASA
jgi:hypothetical protein